MLQKKSMLIMIAVTVCSRSLGQFYIVIYCIKVFLDRQYDAISLCYSVIQCINSRITMFTFWLITQKKSFLQIFV